MERWVIYLIICLVFLSILNRQLNSNEFFNMTRTAYEYIKSFGLIGKVATTVSIGIATALALSFGIAEIAISALFPVYESITMIFLGRILGALASYWLVMKFNYIRQKAKHWLMSNQYLESIESLIKKSPYKYVMLIRFSNLPAPVKNYGLAILEVGQKCYLLGTAIEIGVMSLVKVFVGRQVYQALNSYHNQGTLSIDWPSMAMSGVGISVLAYLSYKVYSDVKTAEAEKAKKKAEEKKEDAAKLKSQ